MLSDLMFTLVEDYNGLEAASINVNAHVRSLNKIPM